MHRSSLPPAGPVRAQDVLTQVEVRAPSRGTRAGGRPANGPRHLAATTGAEDGSQVDALRWESVAWIATPAHLAFAEAAAEATRKAGRPSTAHAVEPPFLPRLLHVLAEGPRRTAVDLTAGPPALAHAAHHAASLLKIGCHITDERGARISFPLDPGRRPPSAWTQILETVAGLPQPTRLLEIARLTGMAESSVRYHVGGRLGYVGLVDCGAISLVGASIEITDLGRAFLAGDVVPRPERPRLRRP